MNKPTPRFIHEFVISDENDRITDVQTEVSSIISKWKDTDSGKWIIEHSAGVYLTHSSDFYHVHGTNYYEFKIVAPLSDHDYAYWALKYK